MRTTKTQILVIILALTLLTLSACSNGSNTLQKSNAALSSQTESASPADDEMSFLEKAYSLGYTDKQLACLEISDIPEDRILNLSGALLDGNTTSNGRYILGWYELDFVRTCWFLLDTEHNRATVLPDWENGYAQFEFLDDESFYACLNNADYESSVRFYKVENPHNPYASWTPADSGASNEKQKNLLYVYKLDGDKMILAFWCETPKEREGRVEDNTETYKITLINYDGDIVKEIDTGILLGQSKTGITAPGFEKANATKTPISGIVYFDIGEISYECNYRSGTVNEL